MRIEFRENLRTIVINLLTCVALLIVIEGLLLVGLKNPSAIPAFMLGPFRDYYQFSDRKIVQVTDCGRYDSGLYYTLRPGQCVFANREFETQLNINSAGLRDDENSLFYPKTIILGDSYTMGWGVDQQLSFPAILEDLTQIKTLNAGVSSYGTVREMQLLKRLSTDSLKFLIVQYHANDYEENQKFLNLNYLPIRSPKSYDSLRSAINNRQTYYPFKHIIGLTKVIAFKAIRKRPPVIDESNAAQSFLKVMKQLAIKPDVQVIVFKVDDYDRLDNRFANAVDSLIMTEAFSDLNVRTVRLKDVLKETDYFVLDDHINHQGHLKIAHTIEPLITEGYDNTYIRISSREQD